jgi:hypothetical protein
MIREFRKAHFAFAMARWATGSITVGLIEAYRELRGQIEKAATSVMAFTAGYILGHVIAAWLRGSFEVIR